VSVSPVTSGILGVALLLKFRECVRVCCLNTLTVSLGAEDLGVGAVVVCETVRCRRVLAEKLELVENVAGYSYSV
jgi:hypothetical protein